MIRVLVAEDSITSRALIVELLRSDPEIQIVGEAANGLEAVEKTKLLLPDVITMDIRMPLMDGFEATRQIMAGTPTPIVIVSGSLDVREVEVSMNALRVGALAVLVKPRGPGAPDFEEQARAFVDTIKSMSQVKVVRRWPERLRSEIQTPQQVVRNGGKARIVAIAASTGGPAAVAKILSELPGDFPLPILLVQHIAHGFVDGFAAWLNTAAALRVKVAENGENIVPRTVYVAPDGCHLGISNRASILLSDEPAIDGFRPSATHLFDSVARSYGNATIALILTGMGRDGVHGLRSVRHAGGRIIAQDEETSVVFGMPGSAIEEGLTDAVLPLGTMAFRLREMAYI